MVEKFKPAKLKSRPVNLTILLLNVSDSDGIELNVRANTASTVETTQLIFVSGARLVAAAK